MGFDKPKETQLKKTPATRKRNLPETSAKVQRVESDLSDSTSGVRRSVGRTMSVDYRNEVVNGSLVSIPFSSGVKTSRNSNSPPFLDDSTITDSKTSSPDIEVNLLIAKHNPNIIRTIELKSLRDGIRSLYQFCKLNRPDMTLDQERHFSYPLCIRLLTNSNSLTSCTYIISDSLNSHTR
jgi:hypothetical protein